MTNNHATIRDKAATTLVLANHVLDSQSRNLSELLTIAKGREYLGWVNSRSAALWLEELRQTSASLKRAIQAGGIAAQIEDENTYLRYLLTAQDIVPAMLKFDRQIHDQGSDTPITFMAYFLANDMERFTQTSSTIPHRYAFLRNASKSAEALADDLLDGFDVDLELADYLANVTWCTGLRSEDTEAQRLRKIEGFLNGTKLGI